MSNNKFTIFTKPFSAATYSPMVRLNIDFVGRMGELAGVCVFVWVDTYVMSGLTDTKNQTGDKNCP